MHDCFYLVELERGTYVGKLTRGCASLGESGGGGERER